jgi:GNAT superfamily N-acetyltransferase
VGVRPDLRRRGIGGQLWAVIETHARAVGGLTLRSWVISDCPDGERFLTARGFNLVQREFQSWVDPQSIDTGAVARAFADAENHGLRVVPLRKVLAHMEPRLLQLFLAGDRDVPHHTPSTQVSANTFRRVILRNPILDQDCSTVVLERSEPVALCWLKGDLGVGRYGIEFTATAPEWRGRGLATLAKLAAYDLAARRGIRWIATANDQDNAPMLAVNRKLGHQRLADLLVFERTSSHSDD